MINLTQTRELIVKHAFFLIAPLTIILLAAIIYSQFIYKPAPKISYQLQTSQDLPKQTTRTSVEYLGKDIEIPKELPILMINSLKPISHEEASRIAQSMGFTGIPQTIPSSTDSTIYLWKNNDLTLSVKTGSRKLQYQKFIPPNQIFEPPVDVNQVITTLKNFLDQFQLSYQTININDPEIEYLEDLTEGSQTGDVDTSRFIKLRYKQEINGLPVIPSPTSEHAIQTLISSTNEIVNFQTDLSLDLIYTPEGPSPAKSFEEVLNELNKGGGVYISSIGEVERLGEQVDVVSAKIKAAQLVYLKSKQQLNQLIPVVLFEGEALLSNKKSENVKIVVSLLKNVEIIQP